MMDKKPLDGIKVVELTTFVAASTAGRFMADWGAEVIKVETIAGDTLRTVVGKSWGVPELWRTPGHDVGFDLANWNKDFVSIDLKSESGMEFLHRLMADADVFITSYRSKALKAMGMDYETVSKKYPGLVYGQLGGYGEQGPDKDLPGYEGTAYLAKGGLYDALRQKGSVPPNFMGSFGDVTAGAYLCSGLCAALVKKQLTGVGEKVVVSLYGSAMFATAYGVEQALLGVQSYPRDRMSDNNPLLNSYECGDGRWVIVNLPLWAKQFKPFVKCMGLNEIAEHPIFSSQVACITQGKKPELTAILSRAFLNKSADEWTEIFHAAGLSIEKMYSMEEIANDPQAWANDYIVERSYPDGEKLGMVQTPVRFESMGVADFRPTGEIGSETLEYMKKCGYSDEEITALRSNGAVRCSGDE